MKPTKFHKISDLMERLNSDMENDQRKFQTESVNGIGKLQAGSMNNLSKAIDKNQPSIKSIQSQPEKRK